MKELLKFYFLLHKQYFSYGILSSAKELCYWHILHIVEIDEAMKKIPKLSPDAFKA
jgi:hypothetical protein